MENCSVVAFTAQVEGNEGKVVSKRVLEIGIEMAVGRVLDMPDSSHTTLVQVGEGFELIEFTQTEPFSIASFRLVSEDYVANKRTTALIRASRNLFKTIVDLNESMPEEAFAYSINIDHAGWLADMIATSLSVPDTQKQDLLIAVDPIARLKKINEIMAEEIEVLNLEDEIQSQVQTELDHTQREYYLREQLRISSRTNWAKGTPGFLKSTNSLKRLITQVCRMRFVRNTSVVS